MVTLTRGDGPDGPRATLLRPDPSLPARGRHGVRGDPCRFLEVRPDRLEVRRVWWFTSGHMDTTEEELEGAWAPGDPAGLAHVERAFGPAVRAEVEALARPEGWAPPG